MRGILTLILPFLATTLALSQSIVDELIWAKDFKDNGLGNLLIETDNKGNIVVAGVYYGCQTCYIEWEGDTIIHQGNNNFDIFLAKIDSNGMLLWNSLIGGAGDETVAGFKVDNNGEIILYTENEEIFSFSSATMGNGHNLLKLDENGQLLWFSNIKGAAHDAYNSQFNYNGKQLSVSCNNDIVIGGSIRSYPDYNTVIDTIIWGIDTIFEYLYVFDTLEIGSQAVSIDTNNIFIAKFESNGDLQWVKTFEHNGWLKLSSLDASKNHEINVLGFFQIEDWEVTNEVVLPIDTIGYKYKYNIYLLKLSNSGELVWANKYFDDVFPRNITTDYQGNIISTGFFQPFTYYGTDTISVTGLADDILLFAVDSLGNYLWGKNAGDQTSNQNCFALANSDNEIYLSGNLGAHLGAIMYKYSPSGDLIWVLDPIESNNRNGGDIAFDNSGNLIQTGIYAGSFIIGNDTLGNSLGAWHQFILKFGHQTRPDTTEDCDSLYSKAVISHEFLKPEIYPNPTTEKLSINLGLNQLEDVEIILFNSNGRLLEKRKSNNISGTSEIFNLDKISSGTYLLKIISSTITWDELIIKI